ncbi:MAG: phospholipase/lecithinase/hemolysin [Oleiphilaceae bacterium]|jgi:phospholipase/lecithinase/hemolysin
MLVAAFTVNASDYSNVYVFGDSLSDNGNLSALAPDQTYGDRFTNGPVAVEIVAGALGHVLTPSYHLLGGTDGNNFAIAGAKAVDEDGNEATPDINLPTQVNAFLAINGGVAPSDALYIMLIGGNDIRAARTIRSAAVFASTPQERQAIRKAANESLNVAVASEQAQLLKLIAAGAHHILVSNAPDIGAIPETDLVVAGLLANAQTKSQIRKANRFTKVTTKLSNKFNRKLARKLSRTEHQTGVDIIEYDLFSFLSDQVDNAEDYGYTNTDDACAYFLSGGGALNPECDGYVTATGFLFFDEIHPTTKAHQAAGMEIVGELFAQ